MSSRKRTTSSPGANTTKRSKKHASQKVDDEVPEVEVIEIESAEDLVVANKGKNDSKYNVKTLEDPTGLHALKEAFFEKVTSYQRFANGEAGEDPFDADIITDFRALYDKLEDDEISERRVLMDQFLRDYLLEKVLRQKERWDSFLELSIKLAREEIASASIPIALVTDLVELSSLQSCEGIFQFVENHLDIWREPFFLNAGKNAVLRMCNDLLRRLSRAQNTIFCGRILIFLSNYFPFSERSGLNIMSEFNMENLTVYKTGDGSDDPEDKMEVSVDKEEPLFEGMDLKIPGLDQMVSICQEEKKKGMAVDYNLYVKFWSLQDFFRNPLQCYNKIAWKTFTSYTGDVLGAFQCFKIEEFPNKRRKTKDDNPDELSSSINIIPKLGDENLYFAKYLTNRRLLELQMGDANFRRYFMVQLLIVLQYLTLSVKFKGESHVLNEEQLEYIRKNTEKIYELLADITPEGQAFVSSVQHILKREELWNKWKNDGCPIFKKPALAQNISTDSKDDKEDKLDGDDEKDKSLVKGSSTPVKIAPPTPGPPAKMDTSVALMTVADDISPEIEESSIKQKPRKKRRQLGDIIKEATLNGKFLLGNAELTRLWNICPDNLEACRAKVRDFMPPIEVFFAEAMKELDSEPAVIPDPKKEVPPKKILGNPNFGWRALRLLARRSPYFFQMVSGSAITPLQSYLEYVLKKIAIDLEVPIGLSESTTSETSKLGSQLFTPASSTTQGDIEGEMEAGAEDDEELIKPDTKRDEDIREEEEGEVRNEKLRNLSQEECVALGKSLGDNWKRLGLKLGFTKDEIEFFETERKTKAGEHMLTLWTEQEGDDATAADLLYILEGLGLSELGEVIHL